MGYIDADGSLSINSESKVRISLSTNAKITMAADMDVFHVSKEATFINTVFDNFKSEAKSSVALYLQEREIELDRLFTGTKLDSASRKIAIDRILSAEKEKILNRDFERLSRNGKGKLYHLNKSNQDFLKDCDEDQYHPILSQYIRAVIEEYCSLPFIERERIYKKEIYETIERACTEKRLLKIKAPYQGKDQLFSVYPYKIVPDSFHTQSYLVCYSRKSEDEDKDKVVASFSMARINQLTMFTKTFHLTKQETAEIESQVTSYPAAYLLGKTQQITVKLTKKGRQSYQTRLFSRPEKIDALSTEDTYVFDCTPNQIFDYFFPFGPRAEIISPDFLRERFKSNHQKALNKYTVPTGSNADPSDSSH